MSDPLSNLGTGYNCTGNQPWGYCDQAMQVLIEQFEAGGDIERRKELAGRIQEAAPRRAYPLSRAIVAVVEFPGSSSASITRPPQERTRSAPTT